MENASLRDIVKMSKEKRSSSDVVTDFPSNITAVRWKDNKVVNAVSTLTGKQPIQQVKRYCHHKNRRVNIEQSNIINQYYMSMRRVDRMDQNISTYMITLHTKKWWWPRFRFVVDVTVNNTHQIYLKFHLYNINIDWMAVAFAESLLMRTTTCTERICHLQHYSQVVAAYFILQTICSLIISIDCQGLTGKV